jgi:ABC-type transporter Mla MlaB component
MPPHDENDMLKITDDPNPGSGRTFRLEGRIGGAWIVELQSVCDAGLQEGLKLTLDLSGVSFLDRAGAALLRSLMQRRVTLVGCTHFVAEQLYSEGQRSQPETNLKSGEPS